MIIKLTYYGTNRVTLVNLERVESMYQVYDKVQRRFSTKICFNGNNSFINVEEDLQTILKLQQEFLSGEYQECDWESQTVDERFEESFYKSEKQAFDRPRSSFREKNYNTINAYNSNQY